MVPERERDSSKQFETVSFREQGLFRALLGLYVTGTEILT
jgi:hypothetical protein